MGVTQNMSVPYTPPFIHNDNKGYIGAYFDRLGLLTTTLLLPHHAAFTDCMLLELIISNNHILKVPNQ